MAYVGLNRPEVANRNNRPRQIQLSHSDWIFWAMYIYLPMAEISMHIAVVIGLGGGVGFLSGMFGAGGF